MSALSVEPGTEFPLVREPDRVLRNEYLVVIEGGDTGWSAYVPDLPGVIAAAGSEQEVRSLIDEAVEFHLEGMREAGLPIPAPMSQAHSVFG
ncbi:MAG TPA: type II toxin-antitoxin system HicB family antitoxin [Thermoleophilaceae bacterium]|jgi:predicted RNase H-like HicB family nuclease